MADQVRSIKLSQIVVPGHMRKHRLQKISELAKDMKEHAQLQDAVVTSIADVQFELLAGNGHYQAAKLNGWEELRCLVKQNVTEEEKPFITISKNENREDVSPVDMGLSYIRAMGAAKIIQTELAKRLEKKPPANHVRVY